MKDKKYAVAFTLLVHEHTDTQLHTTKGIRDEIRAWLDSVDAKVEGLRVEKERQK